MGNQNKKKTGYRDLSSINALEADVSEPIKQIGQI